MADELRRDATDSYRPIERVDERMNTGEIDKTRPDSPSAARIVPLDEVSADFKVAEDDPDIRGWDVRTSDGHIIGRINDLIVDTGQMKARYLVVKLDHELIAIDEDRNVLLPIGEARLDDDEDDVYVNLSAPELAALPAYDRTSFDPAYEPPLRDRFPRGERVAGTASTATAGGVQGALEELAAGNRVPDDERL